LIEPIRHQTICVNNEDIQIPQTPNPSNSVRKKLVPGLIIRTQIVARTSDTPHATDVGDAKNLQHDEGCGCKTILLSLPDRSRIGEI
jgi:hypothetical protein